ncbi:MAG: ABC transporter ATP-binding protein [Clostridiales bacterium]|nr:ABC transporter ATP-binding protein [Clostridiales bacterium]
MIEVKNLTKKYGNNPAIKNISFTAEEGKIYGFLGPNGAGKTTTMNIITGCLSATEGTVLINGYDIYKSPLQARKSIGYLPEQPPLYMDMTPYEYLKFVGEAKGLYSYELDRQIREVIELTQLSGMEKRLIKNLSKGYKQRVGIAQAMLGDPKIIILDEPTVGLDPKQILEIRELIRSLGKGRIVILSSHILSEISEVCDHVMIIAKGRLVANDSLKALEEKYTGKRDLVVHTRATEEDALSVISAIKNDVENVVCAPSEEEGVSRLTLTYPSEMDFREDVYHAFHKSPYPILSMVHRETTLEDIFLKLTSSAEDQNDSPVTLTDIISDLKSDKQTAKDDTDTDDDVHPDEDVDEDVDNEDEDDDYTPLFS